MWPPPTPEANTDHFRSNTFDPFMADPIFFPFGSNGGRFTDPFELFNSIFGDVSRQFHNDPFFNDAFPSSSRSPFGRGAPFGNNPFGGSMFGPGPSSIFNDMRGGNFPLGTTHSAYTSSQSSTFGSNGRWTSQSQVTRTINGRTETVIKQRDSEVCVWKTLCKVHHDVLNVIYLCRVTSMLRVVHRMVKLTP